MTLCLGKLPARHDPRMLYALSLRYLATLPTPPAAHDWSAGMPEDLGMLANDSLGDCAEAMVAHAIEVERAANGVALTFDPSAVVAVYSDVTGYTPTDPTTDQGTVLLDLLNYCRRTGFAGHKLGGYGALLTPAQPATTIDEIKTACWLYGPLYVGVQLPESALADFEAGRTWTSAPADLIAGGHAIVLVGYDADSVIVVTWGKRQRATWGWLLDHVDECYAPFSADWVSGAKPAPSGFAVEVLQADLAEIGAAT